MKVQNYFSGLSGPFLAKFGQRFQSTIGLPHFIRHIEGSKSSTPETPEFISPCCNSKSVILPPDWPEMTSITP